VRELIGLFIDESGLAIAIVVVVVAAMSAGTDAPALVTGGVLLFGCMIAVLENIWRTTQKD
jgi:hypothetical protein